jgi:hypothetical protein
METHETRQVLLKCSRIWPQLTPDEAVQAEWAERLAAVSFPAALEAVGEFCDRGGHEPPTVGEVYQLARAIDERREEDEARRRRKQIENRISYKERAAGSAALRAIRESVGRRL